MAFCSRCGAPIEGRFCTQCGAASGGGSPEGKPTSAQPELASNVAAALCYIPGLVLAIIFLLWAPYRSDKSIRFHAYQSIFLQISWIISLVVLSAVFSMILEPLWFAFERIINLACVLLSAYMIWKTYQKEEIVLPYIGPLAQKQA